MEHNQQAQFGDQAIKEDIQAKFMSQVIAVLKDNREALFHLPEMFEKLIEIQHTLEAKDVRTETLEATRNEEYKLTLAQRDNDDLIRRNQHLMNDNTVKKKRITTLEGTIEDLEGQIRALKTTGSAKTPRDDRSFQKGEKVEGFKELQENMKTRNGQLLAKITEREQELAQQAEKVKLLEATIEDLQGEIKALRNTGSSIISSTTGGNDDVPANIAEKETEVKQQAERIEELEMNLRTTAKENEERKEKLNQLEQFCKSVQSKDREIERLKVRIATLSERRVKQDQSKVEDTCSLNRQSKVEEDFASFFDDTRMDAREKIQTLCSFKEKIDTEIYCPRLLCLIFEAAYEKMDETRRAIFELGKQVTRGFIQSAPEQIKWITSHETMGFSGSSVTYPVFFGRQESQYPAEAVDALMMTLKETAPNCNLDCLVEDVVQAVKTKWEKWQGEEKLVRNRLSHAMDYLYSSPLQDYIKASIRLTWRMVTLTPPLGLEYQSLYLERCHKMVGYHMNPEVCTLAKEIPDQQQKEEIAFYLWPGLLDGEGRCYRKGEVLCKIKANP